MLAVGMLVLLAAFSLAQLRLFIHLYTQDWLIAHMLSRRTRQDGDHLVLADCVGASSFVTWRR